ncbi:hypothetical protein COLO4_36499 [Corchorus olitorius]|uniref:Uncharacterized protein n=1 Tax=Corchorus olitorius TaxID=93759 RepID=A0A1R3G8J6_9ROSI|nr:hypothetical protein COLO4_36499 [Corchorus olitorius]
MLLDASDASAFLFTCCPVMFTLLFLIMKPVFEHEEGSLCLISREHAVNLECYAA